MKPFDKHIPSVFVVCSPFQALCATATVRQLEIEKFKMIVCFPKGDPRNEQLKRFFSENHIEHNTQLLWRWPLSGFVNILNRLRAIFCRGGKYQRLFVGDFRNQNLFYIGCRYANDKSSVVYLDDGNITIAFLKNLIPNPVCGKDELFVKAISKYRKMELFKNFLTIYNDIPNSKYNIASLDLSMVIPNTNRDALLKSGVYIVGTNVNAYCHALNYSYDMFIRKLDELVARIRTEYPSEQIIYIPHGRDKSLYAQNICQKYGCSFHQADMMIELEMLNLPVPIAIYGYTSSALYNLKKMFPFVRVVNILFDGDESSLDYQGYLMTTDYYKKNGIEVLKETIE